MNVKPTILPGVIVIEPRVFGDQRGFFLETYRAASYREAGVPLEFVQDNYSRSARGILRGLHYQVEHPQGKLVWVARGEVYDVAVDLRRWSPTFGRWLGICLSDANHLQLYVPPGLAHGFCVTSESADFVYKCTDYYDPQHERTLLWNDPQLGIDWPIREPVLSDKDRRGQPFCQAQCFETPPPPLQGVGSA
jgi:dTDP-4-dehydrorhamnose 3,5-epimerase